jgi:NAD(P)-dependent dehydrogenase (short-subunit alcohol dehydrogenase family)
VADRLEGKVAIVTGAAGGIGEACVKLFAHHGAKVVFGDIQDAVGEGIARSLNAEGCEVEYIRLDVTQEKDWAAAVDRCLARFGHITSLINNAGISISRGLEAGTREDWDRTIAINQTGVWLGMRAAMPELLKTRGSIVNVSSSYGLIGVPGFTAYTATKAAVRLMSKSVAMEYGQLGVRCNSIHPGPTLTPLAKSMLSAEDIARYEQNIPLRSMGTPDDIAYGAVYLCSDEARWVTGTELIVDGGRTCGR